jgi:hypothetical protein
MVAVVGIEGEDHGNDGPNSMSEYGDRIIRWYAGDPKAYVDFTFRLEDGEWRAVQWVSQNIDSNEV